MKFTIQQVVAMAEVPTPPSNRGKRGQFAPVYEQIAGLKRGKALPVTFPDEKAALYGRSALRKIAERKGDRLSSSRSEDRMTVYFWIEPVE